MVGQAKSQHGPAQARWLQALQSGQTPQTNDSRFRREGVAACDYGQLAHNICAMKSECLAAQLKYLPLCLGSESFTVSLPRGRICMQRKALRDDFNVAEQGQATIIFTKLVSLTTQV